MMCIHIAGGLLVMGADAVEALLFLAARCKVRFLMLLLIVKVHRFVQGDEGGGHELKQNA